jgi:hypothetical protein
MTTAKEKLLEWCKKFDIEDMNEILKLCARDYSVLWGKETSPEEFKNLAFSDSNSRPSRLAKFIEQGYFSHSMMAKDIKSALEG